MSKSIVYRCEDGARKAMEMMASGSSVMNAQRAFEVEAGTRLNYSNKSDFKSLCVAYIEIAEKYRRAEQRDAKTGNM